MDRVRDRVRDRVLDMVRDGVRDGVRDAANEESRYLTLRDQEGPHRCSARQGSSCGALELI
jgi:hypothetical protein